MERTGYNARVNSVRSHSQQGTETAWLDVVAKLDPTLLVINCGLWREHCLPSAKTEQTSFVASVMAAAPHGSVVWKTTTTTFFGRWQGVQRGVRRDPNFQSQIISSFKAAGALIWDAAAVMNENYITSNESLYWHEFHTHCFVHNLLNCHFVGMLDPR